MSFASIFAIHCKFIVSYGKSDKSDRTDDYLYMYVEKKR